MASDQAKPFNLNLRAGPALFGPAFFFAAYPSLQEILKHLLGGRFARVYADNALPAHLAGNSSLFPHFITGLRRLPLSLKIGPMLEPTRMSAGRILIVMPNWLGDAVMATPFLRSIRELYPKAHIAAIGRPLVQPVLSGLELVNEPLAYSVGSSAKPDARQTAAMLARKKFDLAILLPNSFRSSWILWRAGIPQANA